MLHREPLKDVRLRASTLPCDLRHGSFLNADLAEYLMPVNADIGDIEVEFIDKPDLRFNSAGAKGLGEVSMTGVAPAVANAAFHATGRRLRDLPIRPRNTLSPHHSENAVSGRPDHPGSRIPHRNATD